jgi:propionyl-CoA synthetase
MVYAPLLYGCTTVLFEGKPVGTPDAGVFWRVIKDHRVSTLFTSPTALRAIKRDDPQGIFTTKYNLSNLRNIFVAGERCDVYTLKWASDLLGKPIYDHYWQTETGWPIVAPCILDPSVKVILGSSNKPVPGYDLQIVSKPHPEEDDHYLTTPMKRGSEEHEFGSIIIKLPLPPGCLLTLFNDDEGYKNIYLKEYPGFYLTGDAGYKDEDGNVYIMSRTDDIINVAAHRLSTSSMEEAISSHPDVAECAVVGAADKIKGQIPLALIVLKTGVETAHDAIIHECVDLVRQRIGAVASFKTGVVVKRLPKTRSGKVVRNVIRKMADGVTYKVPATIDDIEVISEIKDSLREIGYPLSNATEWK